MSIRIHSSRTLITAFLFLLPICAMTQEMPDIGPTPIPFYTGNLSVDSFMHYWGTSKSPPALQQVSPAYIAMIKRISCFAVCDYASWAVIEQTPGEWNFSLYQNNAERLHAAGIKYNIFCWLQFPPKWFLTNPNFIPYRSLENNLPDEAQLSLWAPETRHIYRDFYKRLAMAMGGQIDFIRLAMPSEYGEIGYPIGMTNWLVPQPGVHPGFWCGDPYARSSFRLAMLKKYSALSSLNKAWGTSFQNSSQVTFPSVTPAAVEKLMLPSNWKARNRWLDFIGWYNQCLTDFMTWSSRVVKHDFRGFGLQQPGKTLRTRKEIIVSLGYGAEVPYYGNDQSRHIAAMKRDGLSVQSPADISYFAERRVSSACALYGVSYYTEPPAGVDRNGEVQRIWMDSSTGSQVYFDYPQNLDGARDLFSKYKKYLTGKRSITNFGLLLPTTSQSLNLDWGWPPNLARFANAIRGQLDYEVIDERMIADGGLNKLGIHLLALTDAEYLKPETLHILYKWVRRGGALVSLQDGPVREIDGSDQFWMAMAPDKLPTYNLADPYPGMEALWRDYVRKIGKGCVMVLPGGSAEWNEQADRTAKIYYNLASYLPGDKNGVQINPVPNGTRASLFRDRILYYNPTDHEITLDIHLRPSDFVSKNEKPVLWSDILRIPSHSISSIPLK